MEQIEIDLTPTPICQSYQTPEKDGYLISPIMSITKSFNGLALALFFLDEKNKYLLGDKKASEITIKELLVNRKNTYNGEKLEKINKWLAFCDENFNFENITIKELASHTSGIVGGEDDIEFEPKIIKLSKDKNPSMFKRLDDGTFFSKEGWLIDSDSFIKYFKNEAKIDLEQKGKFNYHNLAFTLMHELMSLISEEKDFFEEIRNRILKPLNLENQIMPFYEVHYKDREIFVANYSSISIDGINNIDNVYLIGLVNNGSGSLCATMNALKIYAEQLGNFVLGNSNRLIPDSKNQEAKEFYESFLVDEFIENIGVDEYKYSLGVGINIKNGVKHISHAGSLPAMQAKMYIFYKDNKISNIRVVAWQNEIYSNMIVDFFLNIIYIITEKDVSPEIRKEFEEVVRDEFIEKNIDVEKKKDICKKLKEIFEFVKKNNKNENFKIDFKNMLDNLDKSNIVVKKFINLLIL